MANFVCQLDRATRYPGIWPNITFSASVGVFGDTINIYIGRLSKVDCPSYCGWASPNQLKL